MNNVKQTHANIHAHTHTYKRSKVKHNGCDSEVVIGCFCFFFLKKLHIILHGD